jgi:hypothetical protein
MEKTMRRFKLLLAASLLALGTHTATAQGVNWDKVDAALGRKGTATNDVHRYGFPRTDLAVTLDGVAIKPTLTLGGWVAFKPMHDGAMVMGDLVLTEAEITPVLTTFVHNGFDITAIHNHVLRGNPRPSTCTWPRMGIRRSSRLPSSRRCNRAKRRFSRHPPQARCLPLTSTRHS